jgi:glycosyltransferase involved in cell wall biosynthesis
MNILVCALANANSNPRPNRIIHSLKGMHNVSFLGLGSNIEGIESILISKNKSLKVRIFRMISRVLRLHKASECISYQFPSDFSLNHYDLIICHDLELLPYLFNGSRNPNILFDAREYYPKHFESDIIWRLVQSPFQYYLCKKYICRANKCITVSQGLKDKYKSEFSIEMDLFYSLPEYADLDPSDIESNIKLVHHGKATRARKIENIILAMDQVREEFKLDILLVGDGKYFEELKALASTRRNVRIIEPVSFDKIIPTLNQYDVGIVFFPPTTFNLIYCMPNKLFEYIQARLAVVSAPLNDLKIFVEKEHIGLVATSFEPDSLSECINNLSKNNVTKLKNRADLLAAKYNKKLNDDLLHNILKDLQLRSSIHTNQT